MISLSNGGAFVRFARHVAVLVLALSASALSNPVAAHPHVYVTAATTVQIQNGTITGFDHVWTFDELYSAMAVDGLDKNGDAVYSREELSELAKVNIEGLKEFDFFTQVGVGGKPVKIATPTEYWLEHKNGILSLHFKLPLEQPILLDAKSITFQMSDQSFFIAFDMAKKDPVRLSEGAPANCRPAFAADAASKDAKQLADALSQQLSGGGFGAVQTYTVVCPAQ
jgi:ABC-type uncharacterized transport system substrate-binding protein